MLHEPKYWVLALALTALFGAGVALVWPKSRKVGVVLMAVSLLGLGLMYLYWPESKPAASLSIATQGGGTGGSYAGGGGGGAGAPGGSGGTYIQNQYNYGPNPPVATPT